MSIFKRRKLIVEGFQAQFILTLMLWLTLWLLVFSGLLVGPLVWPVTSGPLALSDTDVDAALLVLHARLWLPLLVLFLGLSLLIVRMTHRVAGPLDRFRKLFGRISGGDLSLEAQIRSGDYLARECNDLNDMVRGLRTRVEQARAATTRVRQELEGMSLSPAQVSPDRLTALLRGATEADDALAGFVTGTGKGVPASQVASRVDKPATADSGFSLLELVIVGFLISTIAALAVPAYQGALDRARVGRAIGDISAIGKELMLFDFRSSCFAGSLADIQRDTQLDPWGHPYSYSVPWWPAEEGSGKANSCLACGGACAAPDQSRRDEHSALLNRDFDLYSRGKDGNSAVPLTDESSQDDVVRGRSGGFIGLARDY